MSTAPAWTVLIPMKALPAAKSRLALADDERTGLVLAMLADVVGAARQAPTVGRVVVASADESMLVASVSMGAEPLRIAEGGLNADLRAAVAAIASAARTDGTAGLAVIVADAACLRPDDVESALAAAPEDGQGFVRSLDEGTTMLLARDLSALDPHFGPASASAHSRVGTDLTAHVGRTARVDVDTVAALDAASALGVGRHTATWMRTRAGAPTMPSPSDLEHR